MADHMKLVYRVLSYDLLILLEHISQDDFSGAICILHVFMLLCQRLSWNLFHAQNHGFQAL